jgi:hypothetical protein
MKQLKVNTYIQARDLSRAEANVRQCKGTVTYLWWGIQENEDGSFSLLIDCEFEDIQSLRVKNRILSDDIGLKKPIDPPKNMDLPT